jgi:bacterioferritin
MTESKATLIEGLNEDLAHEYQAVIMYNTFASAVLGIYRKELENFFRSEVPDELNHAQFLSDKIVALGGIPTTQPAPVPEPADVKSMLEATRDAEAETIARYGRRRQQAEAYGDIGLVNDLEELISDETGHKEDTEKMLRGNWNPEGEAS